MGVEEHRNEHIWKDDPLLMTDLLPDLGKPTMKSIEMVVCIVGGIESGKIVLGDLTISSLLH
jgi:hypothetical protein